MKRYICVAVVACIQIACMKSAQFYVNRGNTFAAAGKYEDAALQYQKSIAKDPQYAEAYYRLGLLERQMNHGNQALINLERAVELDRGNDTYAIQLADFSIEAYQRSPLKILYDEASQEARHLLAKNPNSFDGLRLQGDLFVIDRKYDEALADFHKANALNPNDPAVVLAMTQVLFTERRDKEAEDLAQSFLKVHSDYVPMYEVLTKQYVAASKIPDAERVLRSEIAALPKDAHPQLQLAALYRQTGRDQEMAGLLDKLASDHARFPAGPALVGDFYADAAEWQNALSYYRTGLETAGAADKVEYEKRIERSLKALGKNDEALRETEEILKSNPKDADMRFERAILLRESGDPKRRQSSLQELKSLAAEYPQNAVGHYNLALSYLQNGDSSAAFKELQTSSELAKTYVPPRLLMGEMALSSQNYAAALKAAGEILAVQPNDFQAKLIQASAWIGAGSFDEAQNELTALARLQPDSKEVGIQLAALAAARKNYVQAENLYRKYYRPGSGDSRPLQGLVAVAVVEHHPDKAEALLREDLQQEPDSTSAHKLLATVAVEEGKFDLATEQYKWLQSKDPKSPENYIGLGDLYQRQGLTQNALASYEKARDLAPNDVHILNAVAVFQSSAGYNQEAIKTLNQQLALDPNNDVAMNNLAFDLAEAGTDLDRALALAQTVARKYPNNPVVMDTLGWVYTKHSMLPGAEKVLRTLVTKYPNNPTYRYHLAVTLLQDNQSSDAKRELVAALALYPSAALNGKIQGNLARLR